MTDAFDIFKWFGARCANILLALPQTASTRTRQLTTATSFGAPNSAGAAAYCSAHLLTRASRRLLHLAANVSNGANFLSVLTVPLANLISRRKKPLLLNSPPQKRVFYGLFDGIFAGFLSPLLFASGVVRDDALSNLFEQYCDWANHLHPSVFSFLVRASLALGFSTLFCGLAFRRGNRIVLLQAFILLNSIFLAMAIPVEHWQISHRVIKAWVVTICAFLTATLPAVLPLFVAPELGSQQKIRRIIFVIIFGLFVATLIRALSSWKS